MKRWKCHSCDWIGTTDEWLHAPSPFDPSEELIGCPVCKTVEGAELVCDEPDCKSLVSCGFPTANGYRNTCYEHRVHKATP